MDECIHCAKLDLQGHHKMAVLGWGNCKAAETGGVFVSLTRKYPCDHFAEAPKEVAEKRVIWWNNKRGG